MDITKVVAADIMTGPCICVGPDESLARVENLLVGRHITGLPVTEEGRLVGIVSRSDFVRVPVLLDALDGYVSERLPGMGSESKGSESIQFRSRLGHLTVKDIMVTQVITCAPDATVARIASKMVHRHVHRVVVVDAVPVGIVESLDLVRLLAGAD
jgi:CBS domain-containing protein